MIILDRRRVIAIPYTEESFFCPGGFRNTEAEIDSSCWLCQPFSFTMRIIPPESQILEKQLELISNRSTLWTDYGLRSLAKRSSLYMKRNTEHNPPYWRGPIWMNMNYLILSALHHYSQENGPYAVIAGTIYKELGENLIRNVANNYKQTGYLWEQYDQKNKGKGKG